MNVTEFLVRSDGFLPKERYTTAAFTELELQRLWPRVWQIAGREEELAESGDFLEYAIGEDSIVVVRTASGGIAAFQTISPPCSGLRLASSAVILGGTTGCRCAAR